MFGPYQFDQDEAGRFNCGTSATGTSLTFTRRRVLAAAGSSILPAAVWAQSARPIRFIVPTTAGSGSDVTFRAAQQLLSRALGSPVVIDNQAGAGGMIGMQAISRAEPDGYTLGGYSNNVVIQPHVMKAPPIDVTRDLTPVAIIGDTPIILVVNPARIAATDAKELIAIIKSRADKLNFGSGGLGTLLHLAVEIFLNEAGAKVNHIPYKGAAYLTDLIGGQIDFAAAALSVVLPHIKNGSLRPIGMYTERRVALAPEIPTFVEQGLPNCVVQSWLAVFAPKGMAPALVKKIHDAVTFAYNDPVVRDAMALQGTVVDLSSPEQAQATIRRDFAKYASLVKKLGLEPQ